MMLKRKRKSVVCFAVLLIAAMLLLLPRMCFKLPDAVDSLAYTRLCEVMSECMNRAVGRYIAENDISGLYTVKRDGEGNILSVSLVSGEAERLKNTLAEYTRQEMEKSDVSLSVPVGNILGSVLFSGRGGNVNVRILSTPYVRGDVMSELRQSGINQTEHTVTLRLTCSVNALVGDIRFDAESSDDVVLSKNLIVGKIPSSYTDVGVYDEGMKKWLDKYSVGD